MLVPGNNTGIAESACPSVSPHHFRFAIFVVPHRCHIINYTETPNDLYGEYLMSSDPCIVHGNLFYSVPNRKFGSNLSSEGAPQLSSHGASGGLAEPSLTPYALPPARAHGGGVPKAG
jgi:hypothetical protein